MRRTFAAVLLLALVGMVAVAQEQQLGAAAAPQAAEARKKYESAIKAATEAYHKALIAADQRYVSELEAALRLAMTNQDIDLARALDDAKKAAVAILKRDQAEFDAGSRRGGLSLIGAKAQQQSTDLTLPPGCQLYLSGMSSGGGMPSGLLTEGSVLHLENARGYSAAQLSVGTTNVNSYTTRCGVYAIGGVGISGMQYVQGFYGATVGENARSASVRFVLTAPATVVVIGSAGSQNNLELSGLDHLVTDVRSPEDHSGPALTIAHTTLPSGTYTLQERTTDAPNRYDPDSNADLLGVFIFSDKPDAAKSDNPAIPLSGSVPTAAVLQSGSPK